MDILKKKRFYMIFFAFTLTVILLYLLFDYSGNKIDFYLSKINNSFGSNYLQHRDIGNVKNLWINGYLGIFFRFKWIGYFNWIFIPLSIYFLATIRVRSRYEIAVWLAISLTIVVLSIKGYGNHRYQFTMLPILLAAIFLFGYENFVDKPVVVKISAYLFCVATLCFGFNSLKSDYVDYLNGWIFNEKFTYPGKMVEYLKNDIILNENDVILEFNQPFLYYYTEKKGLSYKESSTIFTKFSNNPSKTFSTIKNEFNVKYILTDTLMEKVLHGSSKGEFLEKFARVNCDLVIEDNGKNLYKIAEQYYDTSIEAFVSRTPILSADNLSLSEFDSQLSDEIYADKFYPIDIRGSRGKFLFERINYNNRSVLRVQLVSLPKRVKPELQIGYRAIDDINIQEGDLVSLVSEARIIGKKKNAGHIFIEDKTEEWTRNKEYIRNDRWRQYIVNYKMRKGFGDKAIGIYWEPTSKEDILEIASFAIYIKGKTL